MIQNLLSLLTITTLETKRNLFHCVTQLLFLDYNSDGSLIKQQPDGQSTKNQWPPSVPWAKHHITMKIQW